MIEKCVALVLCGSVDLLIPILSNLIFSGSLSQAQFRVKQ